MHYLVAVYCVQPVDSNLLKLLIPVAVCHALGHVTSNVSFAAVAVSFTHTIKGDTRKALLYIFSKFLGRNFFPFLFVLWGHYNLWEVVSLSIADCVWLQHLSPSSMLLLLSSYWDSKYHWLYGCRLRLSFLVSSLFYIFNVMPSYWNHFTLHLRWKIISTHH